MRVRFKSTLLIIAFLFIGCLVLGGFYITYDHLSSKNPYIKISGTLSINFDSGNHIEVSKYKKTNISIINDSNEDAYYYIEFKNVKNVKKAKYKLTNNKDITIENELMPYNTIVSSYIHIEAGAVEKFDLVFESDEEDEFSLDIDVNMEMLESSNFADVIIKNNEIKKESITKIGTEAATNDEGLIESIDDYGKTYYFRGDVKNNYASVNGVLFRIVRINGDGSIKLVLDNNLELLNTYYQNMYDIGHTDIILTLNNWLITSLGEYEKIVANQKYCNDVTKSNDEFLANERLTVDNIPTFYCLGDSYPGKVALLTADEVVYAGGAYGIENKSYYLYKENATASAFTMTSAYTDDSVYFPFALGADGSLTTAMGTSAAGVRPVITINKTAVVSEGDGSVNNPYILINN